MGHWGWAGETNYTLNQFTPLSACSLDVNAIRAMCRKDSTINNPVDNFFARVFGPDKSDVTSRQAVAGMGYVAGIAPGTGFPIAMNQGYRDANYKLPTPVGGILFSPDGGDNGGWCAPLGQGNPSASGRKAFPRA